MVNGNSIASAACEEYFFSFATSGVFGSLLFGVSSKAIRTSCLITDLLLEEQFAGALRGLHHRFDQRDAQLPFFELHDAVNRAACGSGHCVLQQRRMVAGFE